MSTNTSSPTTAHDEHTASCVTEHVPAFLDELFNEEQLHLEEFAYRLAGHDPRMDRINDI